MIELFSDFDGTLTDKDTLALLLDLYASSDWYAIEKKALNGEIDERQSLADEMALITASDEVLLNTLMREVHPAEGTAELVALARDRDWKMTVLSGGLIRFSRILWESWGYGGIPLFANDHGRDAEGRLTIIPAATPRLKDRCNHCKRWHLEKAKEHGATVVYIGDGLTDFCASEAADRVYAKDNLKEYLIRNGKDFIGFQNLL
ncbi:MAG: MtnX-like HAD-IB family phosphatase, partial [bacterium]